MMAGEWRHETMSHILISSVEIVIEGDDTRILIPAQHFVDAWPELDELQRKERKDWRSILGMRFSWRVVDHGIDGTELQVMIGEQRIDTTIDNRQNWQVTQRSQIHTFERRPPLGAIRPMRHFV